MAVQRARAVQRLLHTLLRITAESCPSTIGLITLDPKLAGERSAGNPHATFDEAGNGTQLTVRLLRHSQRKRRETARPHLRSMAPFLDPTYRGASGNVAMVEMCTRLAIERARTVTLHLQQARRSSIACPEGQITSGRRTHPSSHRQGSVADEQFGRVNRPDWSLVTKSTLGGQAIWQAVTRVKLEQASKVKS